MDKESLLKYYDETQIHKKQHVCTCVPYDYGEVLVALIAGVNAVQILEIGTGIGYTTVCLVSGNRFAHIETIDEDESHLEIAQNKWKKLGISEQITSHLGKAEDILPSIEDSFDVIFFDANTPQKKFITQFERLLRIGGLLITTNLFLKDEKGGKYVLELQNEKKWKTGIFADTALSVKVK